MVSYPQCALFFFLLQPLVINTKGSADLHQVFKPRKKDIAGELVDLYGETHFELLVLSRKPGKVSRFFTGSVHQKVLATLKDTTICVVS